MKTYNVKLTNTETNGAITLPDQTKEKLARFFVNACGGGYSEDQTREAMQCLDTLLSGEALIFKGCKMEIVQ